MLISWGHRANSSSSWRNGYLGKMGQSGVRPIGNLFWDIGLIASYLLYWSLVLKGYARIVHCLMVGTVLVLVLGVLVLGVLVLGVLYCIVQLATVEVAVGSSEYSLLCARVRNSFLRASVC